MVRLLILLAIVVIVVLMVKRLVAKSTAPEKPSAQPSDERTEAKLVRCVDCGAFVPKASAVALPNGFRCGSGCAPR